MQYDLDDLRVVVSRELDACEVRIRHVTTFADDLDREAYRGIGLGIVGGAAAVGGDLGVIELGDVLAEIGVGRQAVAAAIDLGDGEGDPLAGLGIERTL